MEGNRKGYGSYKNMKRTMQEFDTITVDIIQGCENRQQMRSYRTNIEIIAKKRTCRYTVLYKLNSYQKMRTGNNDSYVSKTDIYTFITFPIQKQRNSREKFFGTANKAIKKQIVEWHHSTDMVIN